MKKCKGYEFYLATYCLWKRNNLKPNCEDYRQAVIYNGSIANHAHSWKLDKGNVFVQNKVHPVCGNTYNILRNPAIA
jgi:arsenite methyltransferase